MNQGLNNYKTAAFDDGWLDVPVTGFLKMEDRLPVNAFWPDGSCKLHDLSTGELVGRDEMEAKAEAAAKAKAEAEAEKKRIEADEKVRRVQLQFYRSNLQKLPLASVGEIYRADIFNSQEERKIACEVLLSKLPKFSSAMLERMAKEDQTNVIEADAKFYTWRKGISASATSHTAWGHRRNGGNKGKKETLESMNSEKVAAAVVAARKLRRQKRKEEDEEKKEIDLARKERINLYIASNAKKPEVVSEPVEETEYQKFKREELEAFRVKVVEIDYSVEEKIDEVVAKDDSWKIVDTGRKRASKIEKDITSSLFTTQKPVEKVVPEEVVKVHWKKAKTATIMCRSVAKGEACPHPEGQCNFAHNFEELSPKCCVNQRCRFVQRIGDKYVNKEGKKTCVYQHEGETKVQFCQRIGVKTPAVICTPTLLTMSLPVALTPLSTRVLKPYSSTRAWAPVDVPPRFDMARSEPIEEPKMKRKSRWGARKN